MTYNRAILIGNVGKDPEIRRTQSGGEVASFSLATSETWKDKTTGERKETTEWHNVVIFNEHIVNVVRDFVKKGTKLALEGKIKTRKWQDRDGHDRWSTEVVIERFDGSLKLLGQPTSTRDESAYGTTTTRQPSQTHNTYSSGGYSGGGATSNPAPQSTADYLNDDVPF
jgi:single-strand DNA-binding protein